MTHDPQLKFFTTEGNDPPDYDWMINLLRGKDWMTAHELLAEIEVDDTDAARRRLRATAEASQGRIAGGQKGYKLVEEMTRGEFDHFRNWMLSQAEAMQRRITLADKVFYARKPVPA